MAGSLPSRSMRRERLPSGWRAEALSCMAAPLVERPAYDTPTLVNPTLPHSVGKYPMSPPSVLASPGLRVVGGLIDVVIVGALYGATEGVTRGSHLVSVFVDLAVALAYVGYFWSSRGQTIGMMVFGFRVRDRVTGNFPSLGMAVLRGLVWWLEVWFTLCLLGALAWLWMFWDPQRQGLHDKIAGTVVTAG